MLRGQIQTQLFCCFCSRNADPGISLWHIFCFVHTSQYHTSWEFALGLLLCWSQNKFGTSASFCTEVASCELAHFWRFLNLAMALFCMVLSSNPFSWPFYPCRKVATFSFLEPLVIPSVSSSTSFLQVSSHYPAVQFFDLVRWFR